MIHVPKDEMERDLQATNRDIGRLESIVTNLHGFVMDSGGENRSKFHIDILRYQGILDEAKMLKKRIELLLKHDTH